jgi:hypothetical protein
MESDQERLDQLAEIHHSERITLSYNESRISRELDDIQTITNLPVYMMINSSMVNERSRNYYLEDELLSQYIYLTKFPRWQNLFDNIEGTSIYNIDHDNFRWLRKKQRNLDRKQNLF